MSCVRAEIIGRARAAMRQRRLAALRRLAGVGLYVVTLEQGVLQALRPEGYMALVYLLAMACLATYWCVLDSQTRQRPILHSFYWLIFAVWPLGAAIYLVWSRGWKGLPLSMLHGLGLVLVYNVGYLPVAYLRTPWVAG